MTWAQTNPVDFARSILVIEDDPEIRRVIADVLADEGYQVRVAKDGHEGLEQLRVEPHPSLIILDLMMPIMSGEEFRRAQVSDPRTAEIPVVVMSADANAGAVAQKMRAGCIRKPVSLRELLRVIDQHCR